MASSPDYVLYRVFNKPFSDDPDPFATQNFAAVPVIGVPVNIPAGNGELVSSVRLAILGFDADGNLVTSTPGNVDITPYELIGGVPGIDEVTASPIVTASGTTLSAVAIDGPPVSLGVTPGKYLLRFTNWSAISADIEKVVTLAKLV